MEASTSSSGDFDDIQIARAADHSYGEQQGIAGQKQPDQQASFGKHNAGQQGRNRATRLVPG